MFGSVAYPRKAMLLSAAGICCLLAASFACSVLAQAAGYTPVPSTTWLQLADATSEAADQLFLEAVKLYRAGDFPGAVEQFQMGLTLDPENPAGHFYLAETYAAMKRDGDALRHYEKAAEFGPGSKEGIIAGLKLKKLGQKFAPGKVFKDCDTCPEMVIVPAGSFMMGSTEAERKWAAYETGLTGEVREMAKLHLDKRETPNRRVTLNDAFAIGRYEVTVGQWNECVAAAKCKKLKHERDVLGKLIRHADDVAVHNVSWKSAKSYLKWLSKRTGHRYRLPSEAEWEYMARAGTSTPFYFGQSIDSSQANIRDPDPLKNHAEPISVGQYEANAFGVYDTHGNVEEMVEDCSRNGYSHAPSDGSAYTSGSDLSCDYRITRGGWYSGFLSEIRLASRQQTSVNSTSGWTGFRVVRELD